MSVRRRLSAAVLALLVGGLVPAGAATVSQVDAVVDIVDQQVALGSITQPSRSEAIRAYQVCCPSNAGFTTFEERALQPVPADGSVLTGGSVIAGRSEHVKANTAVEANVVAWVRADKLEILGGSAKGGITIRHMLVHADLSCRNGPDTRRTTFAGVEVAGSDLSRSPEANTKVIIGPYTVILNEQHVSASGLGLAVTGVHIWSAAVPGVSERTEVRIASITDSLNCPKAHWPSAAPIALTLSAPTKGQPDVERPWAVDLTVMNRSATPCTLASVELWNPRPEFWRVASTSGRLGSSFQDTSIGFGDAIIARSLVLAPGARISQRFVLVGRKRMPIIRPSGFLAQATCNEGGTWSAPLGGFPKA